MYAESPHNVHIAVTGKKSISHRQGFCASVVTAAAHVLRVHYLLLVIIAVSRIVYPALVATLAQGIQNPQTARCTSDHRAH